MLNRPMGMASMPGLANGLPGMGGMGGMRHLAAGGEAGGADASNGPSMAYGGFARGGSGLADPFALVRRGQIQPVMQGAPYSTGAGGLINSLVPGRTDQLPLDVPSGSYILPADVVAAMGQGNTMAGAKLLDQIFTQPPGGMPLGLAGGGRAEPVKTIVAGGEFLVSPRAVLGVGRHELGAKAKGATHDEIMAAGHKALDRMVLKVRAQAIKHQKNLPGPKK